MKTLILFLIVGASLPIAGQSEKSSQSNQVKPLFLLSISSEPVFALGSPVEVKIRIRNTSAHEIHGSSMNLDGFAISYNYDVRDQSGNKLEQKPFDQTHPISGPVFMLKPGQSQVESTVISAYYDFWPGRYRIQLSKPDPGAEVVKSNKISITVTP